MRQHGGRDGDLGLGDELPQVRGEVRDGVNGGNLTELGTSPFPLPGGAAPAGIIVS